MQGRTTLVVSHYRSLASRVTRVIYIVDGESTDDRVHEALPVLKLSGQVPLFSQLAPVLFAPEEVIGGEILIAPVVYATYAHLSRALNEREQVNEILIDTESHDQSYFIGVSSGIEGHLDSTAFRISAKRTQ